MTAEAGTREIGGSRRKEGSYPVADEDWQDGVTVAAPRFARVVTDGRVGTCLQRTTIKRDWNFGKVSPIQRTRWLKYKMSTWSLDEMDKGSTPRVIAVGSV